MHLQFEEITNFKPSHGEKSYDLKVSFEIFGQVLYTAPIVLINHALTGNSDVISSEKGWWKDIVGENKLIDLNIYTVIAFNIPGNGYDGTFIKNYKEFTAKDIAKIFYQVLSKLEIDQIYAIIGGSLGGGIAWEMVCLYPDFAQYVIPVATNYRSNDWIIGHNYVQESILLHSNHPLQDVRKMAMLFYRTPQSFTQKFNRTKVEDNTQYNVESWLEHHAHKLANRFHIQAYLLMNHLLTTVNVVEDDKTVEDILKKIKSTIVQITVSSDLFFIPDENLKTKKILDDLSVNNEYHQIESIDGHDAFLIEHQQITNFLGPIFKK